MHANVINVPMGAPTTWLATSICGLTETGQIGYTVKKNPMTSEMLTVDDKLEYFAGGRGNSVSGNAHVFSHFSPGDSSHFQL